MATDNPTVPPLHGPVSATNPAQIRTTADTLLGGRLKYQQPGDGLRASLDPVLLAAAIPARVGELVLEGGTGAGAALLCVAARVAGVSGAGLSNVGVSGVGIDRDVHLLRLARDNARANGFANLSFVAADLATSPIGPPIGGGFDHAFANPPYHAPDGTPSPSIAREAAKRGEPALLPRWVEALSRPLRHRGTLTFILPPRLLPSALAAMHEHQVGPEVIFPIWPKAGRPARFVVLRGRKHGHAPLTLAAGLILHTETGAFRPETEAILRGETALLLA